MATDLITDEEFEAMQEDLDLQSNSCTLVPVFCTVQVPSATLDAFITAVRKQAPPSEYMALCILSSTKASDYIGGTRTLAPAFTTPFKGKDIKELRKIFEENFNHRDHWSESCFVVLDERFLKDGTVLLVSSDVEFDEEDEEELEEAKEDARVLNYRCEGTLALQLLNPWEMNRATGRPWHDDDWEGSDAGGYVFTNEEFQDRIFGRKM